MSKPVAVLGGGNGGHMMAAELTYKGFSVQFYEHPKFLESFSPTLEKKAIEVVGIGPRGTFPIPKITTDMGEALEGVEWIHVVIPASGHELFFDEMIPYLKKGQRIVLWAGDFGSLRLKKLLAVRGKEEEICIIETNTLPYGTRLSGPAQVNLLLIAPKVMAATIPASRMKSLLSEFQEMFPCILEGQHVLAAAFNNPNPIVHPPGSLLNTGRIQYSQGNFYMYREGITEAVAFVIREIYNESQRVAEAFDFNMIQYRDIDFQTTASIMGAEFIAPFDTFGVIATILGPTSVQSRYITEDLPFGLVPRSGLGRIVDIPTPVIDGIVSIGSIVCREDYWKTGRTLKTIGLDGMSRDEILRLL